MIVMKWMDMIKIYVNVPEGTKNKIFKVIV